MAFFLVDLEFREKAKNILTSKELFACVLFLLFALVPWVQVLDYARDLANMTSTYQPRLGDTEDHHNPACNPHSRACL